MGLPAGSPSTSRSRPDSGSPCTPALALAGREGWRRFESAIWQVPHVAGGIGSALGRLWWGHHNQFPMSDWMPATTRGTLRAHAAFRVPLWPAGGNVKDLSAVVMVMRSVDLEGGAIEQERTIEEDRS